MKKIGASLEQAMPKESENDYETEGHLRTLGDAADIMGDQDKMDKVHALAGRKHKAVMGLLEKHGKKKFKSLDDLKKFAGKNHDDME